MDVLLFGLLLVAVLFGIAVMILAVNHLLQALDKLGEDLNSPREKVTFDIDAIKSEILGVVEDTVANLQPPTAMDHLLGALAQFAQMKMMKSMGLNDFQPSDIMNALNPASEVGYEDDLVQEAV